MLPVVCSAAPSCSSHSPISLHIGPKAFSSLRKAIVDRHIVEDTAFFANQNGSHNQEVSLKQNVTKYLHSLVVERSDHTGPVDSSIFSSYPNEFDDIVRGFSNEYLDSEPEQWSCLAKEMDGIYPNGGDLKYVESSITTEPRELLLSKEIGNDIANELGSQSIMAESSAFANIEFQPPATVGEDELLSLQDSSIQTSSVLSESVSSRSSSVSASIDDMKSVSDTFEATNEGFSRLKENIEHFLSGINEPVDTSIDKAQSTVENSYNTFILSVEDTVKSLNRSFDNTVHSLFFSVENSKEQTGSKLAGISSEFKDGVYGAGHLAIDLLRKAIVSSENSLGNATTFVVYSYESAKTLLPPEVRDLINITEGKAVEILRPIVTAFQQVYIVIEGLERNIGLDPNDPVVPFIFLIVSSATLGISHWVLKYGGYSGDLSPEVTLELLKNEENAALIDVRPEDLRERDGIPDLRRGARSKYASVTLPELGGPARKLLKSGRDIDDALLAVVIRNLKIIQDGSKVIIMDASGARSKGIARSLRKLGVKQTYLVQGGFRSWVKSALRIKELKPETTLTVLNEEAEAILEDIRPTPALIIGYGLGVFVAIYALLEWEKTLQFIGVIGLGQTLYRRVASYEDSEDLKQDVRLLLAPVRLGAQAFSWATGQIEPNKIGLPTSPSSTAVQDRVLQAAAKHGSQPSDSDETPNPSLESTTRTNENLEISEA